MTEKQLIKILCSVITDYMEIAYDKKKSDQEKNIKAHFTIGKMLGIIVSYKKRKGT